MITIKQYPHYLFVERIDTDATRSDGGAFDTPQGAFHLHALCRHETSGGSDAIASTGGYAYPHKALIQLPRGTAKVPVGARVFVSSDKEGRDVRISGEVLLFDSGQLHARLWL